MSVENTITKTLPESEKKIDITVRVKGDDGEDVQLRIATIPSGGEISDRTKEKADRSRYYQLLWPEILNDSVEDYKVKYETRESRSGNYYLDYCYIQLDYFEERNIENIIRTLLNSLDRAIVTEANRQQVLDQEVETAQQMVCDNISSRVEDITLEQ